MNVALEPMTFNRAKLELRLLGRSYESGSITIDTWLEGVHEVILAFQEGRDARSSYASALSAPAFPAPADTPKAVAAQVVRAITHPDGVEGNRAPGQPA